MVYKIQYSGEKREDTGGTINHLFIGGDKVKTGGWQELSDRVISDIQAGDTYQEAHESGEVYYETTATEYLKSRVEYADWIAWMAYLNQISKTPYK